MNTIKIKLNGEDKEISSDFTIKQLLDETKLKSKMMVVEKNMEIIPKEQYDSSLLKEGDSIEIVGFFGGG